MSRLVEDAGSVDVEGASLRYRIEGDGAPCLVIGSAAYYPRVFSPDLRQHLQMAFADVRHFGSRSEPSLSPDRITIDRYAADVERVREALHLGDVILIGHSIHATVALEYARRYPEHVRGVVAIGGTPVENAEARAVSDAYWLSQASDERKKLLVKREAALTPDVRASLSDGELFVREYITASPWYWFDPTYDASWLWEGVTPDMAVLNRLGELLDPYHLSQGPGRISVPVLIAQGRFEFGAPYTLWEAHRHELPRATLVLFERSAHTPPLEEPAKFDRVLLAWIDTLNVRSDGRGSNAADRVTFGDAE